MAFGLWSCANRGHKVSAPIYRTPAANSKSGDDTLSLQRTIDECANRGGGVVLLGPGVYQVRATPYFASDGSILGARGLWLRSHVHVRGSGETVIRVADRAYGPGANFALLGNSPDAPLVDASIQDLIIDGNREAQIPNKQAGNVLLECTARVHIANVCSRNANGTSIMLRGRPDKIATQLVVRGCVVEDANFIGIQMSQFVEGEIEGNIVSGTGDNGIDIFGEVGTTVAATSRFRITRNRVAGGNVGILVETSRDGEVSGNWVSGCKVGIAVNRINGEPRNIFVTRNQVSRSLVGVRITGDTGGVIVRRNQIREYQYSAIQLGDGAGNVSRVEVTENWLSPASTAGASILVAGRQASFLSVHRNWSSTSSELPVESKASATVDVSVARPQPLPPPP